MKVKIFHKPDYNYTFDLETGLFTRWGADPSEDPECCTYGPEILDIEISTICSRACSFCYKGNTSVGSNMSIATFRSILSKMPETVCQIALGIGDMESNPDVWDILKECRKKQIVPNITIHGEGMTDEIYDRLASLCGAVAVSLYDRNTCYEAVRELTMRGVQTNIHCILADEFYGMCTQLIEDIKMDQRLAHLDAVIYLWLKQVGDKNTLHPMPSDKFETLLTSLFERNIPFGFDSCSANNVMATARRVTDNNILPFVEPCESTLFSYYINVDGMGYPCSFLETKIEGVNVLESTNFIDDVWNNEITRTYRNMLLMNKRGCPMFRIDYE